MRSLVPIVIVIFWTSFIKGQVNDSLSSPYYESMLDKLAIEINGNNSYEGFKVDTPTLDFELLPNAKTKIGLLFNYRFLSVGFSVAPNFIPGNDDEKQKGKTSTFELGTAINTRHWVSSLYYKTVKGYYLSNSDEFSAWTEGEPYLQFPNLKYSGITFTLGYSLNENFSFASIFSQTERQLRSVGSFVPNLEFRWYTIDDTERTVGSQKSVNTEITAGPGYAYTFVFARSYFVSVVGKAGIGYHRTALTIREEPSNIDSSQNNFLWRWEGATGMGYNGKKIYTGIYGVIDGGAYNQEGTTARTSQTRFYFRAYIGYRFKAPGFVKKPVDFFENLLSPKE